MKKIFIYFILFSFIINAEDLSNTQRKLQLDLAKVKLRLIEEDEELYQLHRKILKLHQLLAEKLAKKKEVIELNKKIAEFK